MGGLERKYEEGLGVVLEADEKGFLTVICLLLRICPVEVLHKSWNFIAMLSSRSLNFVTSGRCVCVCVSQHWDHPCLNDSKGLNVVYILF